MVSLYNYSRFRSLEGCLQQTKGQQKLRGTVPRSQLNHNYQKRSRMKYFRSYIGNKMLSL